jgi:hypothetical protein
LPPTAEVSDDFANDLDQCGFQRRLVASTSTGNRTMSSKCQILNRFGETAVRLPELIGVDLTANERAKMRLTILQEMLVGAQSPAVVPRDLSTECRQAGLDDPRFDDVVTGAQTLGTSCFAIPAGFCLKVCLMMLRPCARHYLEQRSAAVSPCPVLRSTIDTDERRRIPHAIAPLFRRYI